MRPTTLLSLSLLAFCSLLPLVEPVTGQETKTLWVAHRRVDCVGVAPQKCYLVKETQYEDWRFWYGEIEGFDYQEGYAYEIEVIERQVEDPPADASAIELVLVEVLLKVETFDTPEPAEPPAPAAVEPPASTAVEPLAPTAVEPLAPTAVEPPASTAVEPPAPVTPMAPVVPSATEVPPATEAPPAPPAPGPASEVESVPEPQPVPVKADQSAPPVAPDTPVAEPPSSAAFLGQAVRGHLSIGAGIEARSFKPCGAEESLWVEDRTDNDLWGLYRRLASYPNRPVFMEVIGVVEAAPAGGFGAHFRQQILIQEVRNASVESAGCFAEPPRYAFRASGNEPFWKVEVSRRGLSFSELGQQQSLLFPYAPPTFFAEQIIYRSQIRGAEPRSLVLRLVEEPCNDSMADATFSFSASAKVDNRTLKGCARRGADEP